MLFQVASKTFIIGQKNFGPKREPCGALVFFSTRCLCIRQSIKQCPIATNHCKGRPILPNVLSFFREVQSTSIHFSIRLFIKLGNSNIVYSPIDLVYNQIVEILISLLSKRSMLTATEFISTLFCDLKCKLSSWRTR